MKKVLIITNIFNVSTRMLGLAKYLPYFGYEPTILTMPKGENPLNNLGFVRELSDKIRIIETPYGGDIFKLWRKIFKLFGFKKNESILEQMKEKLSITSKRSFIDNIFNLYRTIFAYPDEEKNWKEPAIEVATQLLKREKFNSLISSSPPVISHIITYELKKRFHIPWVADLRDPWTQNYNYPFPHLRKKFEEKLELKILSIADFLVTVSGPLAEKLKKLHKEKTIYPITNGFDPEYINTPPVQLTSKFTLTYTGQIYLGKQDPLKVLIALKELISENSINSNDVEVRFYGPEYFWLRKKIEEYKLSNIVRQYGKVPREISLKKQRESQLLLLLNWEDPKEKGIHTGKIFEYLAAKRPIIVTGGYGQDVLENLIRETKAGLYCPRVEDIKDALKNFYLEYKNTGKVTYKGDWKKIQKYSYREIAKKFAEVLNHVKRS